MNPEKIREDFPFFENNPDTVYLDNAATSQKPSPVIERVKEFCENSYSNIGRGIYDSASESTEMFDLSRKKVSDFIGARQDETVFVRNTTEAVNIVANCMDTGKVVMPVSAHHSLQLPMRRSAEKYELVVPDSLGIEEHIGKAVDSSTDFLAVSHISNVLGDVRDLDYFRDLAEDYGFKLLVDAAQSAPRKSLNLEGIDFLMFSGHKVMGPSGTGVLYGRKEHLEDMDPYQLGGGMVSKVGTGSFGTAPTPEKFEAGTRNIEGVVGLGAAVDYLEDLDDRPLEHDRKLVDKLIGRLEEFEQVEMFYPEDSSPCILSFSFENAHPHDVAEVFNSKGICVRAGNHCAQPLMDEIGVGGTVRVSPYIYNTEKEIEEVVEAVEEVVEVFSG